MNFINRITNNWSAILSMLCLAAIVLSSCSGEDEIVSGGIEPDKNVPDPAETITISMRNYEYGNTYLDNIHIVAENFTSGWGTAYFASVGAVRGLGNVANIPITGWADMVAVIPGNGYVAYSNNKFYRIYVTDCIVNTTGEVIGAVVKYQKPFNGRDEAILLGVQSVTIPAEGGVQTLIFKNQGVIMFDIEKEGIFTVEKASTCDYPFLTDAIAIRVTPNYSIAAREGVVTLTTAYGKRTQLKVIQAGSEPYVTFGRETWNLTAAQQTQTLSVSGNITFSNLSVSSSATWCKAELVDNTSSIQTQDKIVKFIGDQPVNTTRATTNVSTSYSLKLSLDENVSAQPRSTTIIVRSRDGRASDTLKVVQKAACASFGQEQIELSAASQTKQISYTSDLDISQLQLKSSAEWCKVNFVSNNTIQIECNENYSKDSRLATIMLQTITGVSLAKVEVLQAGFIFEVSSSKINFDKSANNRTISITTTASSWDAVSSANWCTFSRNGNQLTISATATTADRTAVISFKGIDTKITVQQSKYAVGDSYNEDGIEGVVGYIGDKGRYIFKGLGYASWSEEDVLTEANNWNDGEYNMNVIKSIPRWEVNYPAFRLCEELNTDGVSGWYLPAIRELQLLSGIKYGWSSTESETTKAYFREGSTYRSYIKSYEYYSVYAVRKF